MHYVENTISIEYSLYRMPATTTSSIVLQRKKNNHDDPQRQPRRIVRRCYRRVALVRLYAFWPSPPSETPPTTPSRNGTKISTMEPARPRLHIPINVEPQNPFGDELRSKIRRYAHQLCGGRYLQITSSPNRPKMCPVRGPRPALRMLAVRVLRHPSDLAGATITRLRTQLRGRRNWQRRR